MTNEISVARAKFELNKILEKLNQFNDDEILHCWHIWMDDTGIDQADRMNFVNAIQIYRDLKHNELQMDINCYD